MLTKVMEMYERKYTVYFEKDGFKVRTQVDYWIDSSTSEKFYDYSKLPKTGFPCNRITSVSPVVADDGSLASLKVEFMGTDESSSLVHREHPPLNMMRIRIVPACINYSYIPLREREGTRSSFPGYKVPFTMKTNVGDIQCQVTSDFYGSQIGSSTGGRYIAGGLKPWFEHNKVKVGDTVVIKIIEPMKVYALEVETAMGSFSGTKGNQ